MIQLNATAALKNSAHKNDRDWVDIIMLAQNRQVFHKIGVTGGDVAALVANAKTPQPFCWPKSKLSLLSN